MSKGTEYFYDTLRELVTTGQLPDGHPLTSCPLDPFSAGTNSAEKHAIAELRRLAGDRWAYDLRRLAGDRWAYDLRRLYYGYVSTGRRISAIHTGLVYLTMYDDELRALLRSHEDDEQIFPRVYVWNELAEKRFYETIRRLDVERVAS